MTSYQLTIYFDTSRRVTNLTFFPSSLSRNDLTGSISPLQQLTNLMYVDLSSNELNGTLMDAGNLMQLETFKVGGNQLTGHVPKSFGAISALGNYKSLGTRILFVHPCLSLDSLFVNHNE